MSKVAITGNASGTGTLTIAAPNTNTDRVLDLPDAAGTMYNQGNILGTVSQSGGVPTGAIIERGSNANGEYVKYADGTMICTRVIAKNNGTTSDQTFDFPATFASTSNMGVSVNQTSSIGTQMRLQSFTTSSFNVAVQSVIDSTASSGVRNGQVIAIGRWF